MKHSTTLHLVLAIGIGIASLLAYNTWFTEVKKASAEAAALEEEITMKEVEIERALAVSTALGSTTGSETRTPSYFIDDKEIVPFLEKLQATGESVGARTTIASVAADANEKDPSIRISLSLLGSFDSVARAIGAIEHSPYALRSEVIDMTTADTTQASWSAHMIILVSTPIEEPSTTTP